VPLALRALPEAVGRVAPTTWPPPAPDR